MPEAGGPEEEAPAIIRSSKPGRVRRPRGHTLVELMVILVITGLLLSLIMPRMAASRGRAMLTACVANERNIGTALQAYRNDNERFPNSLDQLRIGNPPPMRAVPTCPTNGTTYGAHYLVNNANGWYTIACGGVHHLQVAGVKQGFPQYYSTGQLDMEGREP